MSATEYMQKDEVETGRSDAHSFVQLLRYTAGDRGTIARGLALLGGSSLCAVAGARLLGALVERAFIAKDFSGATYLGAGVLAAELGALAFYFFGRMILNGAASRSLLRIREACFARLHELPMTYFDRQPLGRTVVRMTHDVESIEEFFSSTLARLLTAVFQVAIVITAMFATDLRLASAVLLTMVPALILTVWSRKGLRHWNREMSRRNSAINAQLSEFLNGLDVIRNFGSEEWARHRYHSKVRHYRHASLMMNQWNAFIRPSLSLLCLLPLLVLIAFGGKMVFAGTITVGLLVTFARYCERFSYPIESISHEIHLIQQAFASADRVAVFLNEPSEDHTLGAAGTLTPRHLEGRVEFKNVSMSYDGKTPVLNGVSFTIEPGQHVGLAGRTGSGKTTTVALLARLYEFQQGEILIDGVSIRDYKRSALRAQLGFVSQDVVIFKGSLRENLRGGKHLSDEQILRACDETGLARVFRRTGMNLDSHMLEQGANLSVGEKQLVALTRVLLLNPSLLVLDEATANVDPEYEALIHQGIERVMRGRTCLLIAHRLATLGQCDQILVFRDGLLQEHGTHSSLSAQGGYYASLVRGHEKILAENP